MSIQYQGLIFKCLDEALFEWPTEETIKVIDFCHKHKMDLCEVINLFRDAWVKKHFGFQPISTKDEAPLRLEIDNLFAGTALSSTESTQKPQPTRDSAKDEAVRANDIISKLHEIEQQKTIYNIHNCNAGWGIIFYEPSLDKGNFRDALTVDRYYATFEEAIDAEYKRLTLAGQSSAQEGSTKDMQDSSQSQALHMEGER
jgi:hypothetical protein